MVCDLKGVWLLMLFNIYGDMMGFDVKFVLMVGSMIVKLMLNVINFGLVMFGKKYIVYNVNEYKEVLDFNFDM